MNDRAKEIFVKYNGSHCQMENDGIYDEYKKYNISRDTEKQWLAETERKQIGALKYASDIKSAFVLLCLSVGKSKDKENFDKLFSFLLSETATISSDAGRLYMVGSFVDLMNLMKDRTDISYYKRPLAEKIQEIKKGSTEPDVLKRADAVAERLEYI